MASESPARCSEWLEACRLPTRHTTRRPAWAYPLLVEMVTAIRAARVARGWTQAELAERVGVKVNRIQHLELYASVHPRTAAAVLRVLGLHPTEKIADLKSA